MKYCLRALLCLLLISTANAVEVPGLYTAQVAIDQEQDDPRAAAYETALAVVLLRVSGGQVVDDPELFEALFPNPAAYVVQYRPGPDETLFVSFDGEAVEAVLRGAGQLIWGSDRPLTIIWLAVDWGGGEREILSATDDERDPRSINRNRLLRERILDFAERRGLPVAFPLLDSEDLANVGFSDVWGGFDETIIAASARYETNSVLIGRVDADGVSLNRWTYHFGPERRTWLGEPELVLSNVADMLAAEFAIGGDEPLRALRLNVSGITSVTAYGDIQAILREVNVIDSFSIVEVAGDRISFEVRAHGGSERLARALRLAGLLEQERIDMGSFDFGMLNDDLEFFYDP
ncbi:MAG: DUF2066 domain-containing protein [Woeseiaceae bacterium]|nr:DUF2066 domain-containing protein [Woeseiaceae bacterium]